MHSRIAPALIPYVAALLLAASGSATRALAAEASGESQPGDTALLSLADDYFDHFYFPQNPSAATAAGIHDYDEKLEDLSRAGVERQVKALRRYAQQVESLDESGLSERVRGDRELLLASIRGSLLTLEIIRPWEKDPDSYPSAITQSAYSIMERNFATPNERLRLLLAREMLMPAALAAGRANLRNPPRIYSSIALEQMPGVVSFFARDLPSAFSGADDRALQARFKSVNARVIAALKSYEHWLRRDLLARSHGDFRLGERTFSAKLLYDEMVDTPLDKLLEIGTADLKRNQAQFIRVAKELEPDKSAAEVLAELAADHPAPAALLESFHATFDGLVEFINARQIITIPSATQPTLRETPPFMRATTFASMDTPGPYEALAQEAYFNVTLPDPSWDPKHTAGFMAQFNFPVISAISVHEAYPGHYIQFLWMRQIDDRVRKLIGANSNAEGWAHYCEQMMLDEGYGQSGQGSEGERAAKLLRLGQLQDALLRDARYIVGISMHTGRMNMAQAEDFFVKEGYQSHEVGEMETKRGTSDPTYLYYTLGKLEILKLRADMQAREGSAFNLRDFHDAFMQQGYPPIKLVRRALLHDDSPAL
jgi:uncharacterized protein (DUF885 family)